MAVVTSVPTAAGVLSLPTTWSYRNSSAFVEPCGSGARCFTVNGWNVRAVLEVQSNRLKLGIVSRGRIRVRGISYVRMSMNGDGVGGVEESGIDAALWLRENLPQQLERDDVDVGLSKRIAEACADACANFLATGRAFDPMMIMDAMEEEVERRDLRGDDFLPFEIGRKAAKVLTQRWDESPVTERPRNYRQQPYLNKKDVVDFDKWPENLNLP